MTTSSEWKYALAWDTAQWYETGCAAELSDPVLFNFNVSLEVEYRVFLYLHLPSHVWSLAFC